jgi:Mn2+/Fe2+ NRAMP family transporter
MAERYDLLPACQRPYDIKDRHTAIGVASILAAATLLIFFIGDPFQALVLSQMILAIQLPVTVFLQIYLTSSEKVMGKHKIKSREDSTARYRHFDNHSEYHAFHQFLLNLIF